MNLSYLKYAIEVEKTGSITKTAQNFYMSQPHLSKTIRELERDLGYPIFGRTSRGMVPAKRRERFLHYVKTILAQEEQIESLCAKNSEHTLEINPSVLRATYTSCAFTDYLKGTYSLPSVSLGHKETSSRDTIRGMSSKNFDLGTIWCQILYESHYMKILQDESLGWKELWEFSCNALMSAGHPLTDREHLTYLGLADCMGVVRGDIRNPSFTFEIQSTSAISGNSRKTISVYDRGSQFEILRQILGTYVWTSPTPRSRLETTDLIQKPCSYSGSVRKDLLIYRSGHRSSRNENEFLHCPACMISRLSVRQPVATP